MQWYAEGLYQADGPHQIARCPYRTGGTWPIHMGVARWMTMALWALDLPAADAIRISGLGITHVTHPSPYGRVGRTVGMSLSKRNGPYKKTTIRGCHQGGHTDSYMVLAFFWFASVWWQIDKTGFGQYRFFCQSSSVIFLIWSTLDYISLTRNDWSLTTMNMLEPNVYVGKVYICIYDG